MEHYICTAGCRGVSDEPVNCGSVTCANYQKPLEECRCEDDLHFGAFDPKSKDQEE